MEDFNDLHIDEESIPQSKPLGIFGLLFTKMTTDMKFVGMFTDSRSFLSYPRHEYFRRIMCNLFGEDMENGEIPNDLDLVYIDANHEYESVLNDMGKWLPKVRTGGILSGDDYSRPQTAKAVVDFLKDYPQYDLQISDNGTQWWFVKGQ